MCYNGGMRKKCKSCQKWRMVRPFFWACTDGCITGADADARPCWTRRQKQTPDELSRTRSMAAKMVWQRRGTISGGHGWTSIAVPGDVAELLRDEARRRGVTLAAMLRTACAVLFRPGADGGADGGATAGRDC